MSWPPTSRPLLKAATLVGSSATRGLRSIWKPSSEPVTTWLDTLAMACASCMEYIAPAAWRSIGCIMAPKAPSSGGSCGDWPSIIAPIAVAMEVTIGSVTCSQAGIVSSIHSARLHATADVGTGPKSQASSSHRLASRSASATSRCWAGVQEGSGPSEAAS